MTPGMFAVAALLAIQVFASGGLASAGSATVGPAYGTYQWPVRGPVIRGYEPPPDPYGPGHRGIDIAAPFGSDMVAAQDGVVAFAGWVAGSLFISIDHPDGVRTTYSWLSATRVKRGASVTRGSLIGSTGAGHPGLTPPHLHFGARVGITYIDPMLLLEGADVVDLIHLAPLPGAPPPGRAVAQGDSATGLYSPVPSPSVALAIDGPSVPGTRAPHPASSRERGPPFGPLIQ